ncbi:conserved hypothetical protein [Synechococcus sp. WH 8103]|nr:conserved hypothetical protein [Synechococcus sp. WH 8103]
MVRDPKVFVDRGRAMPDGTTSAGATTPPPERLNRADVEVIAAPGMAPN